MVLEKDRLENLGQILRQSLDLGNAVEDFLARVRGELKKPAKEAALTERQAAKLLFAADCPVEAGQFLPGPEKAVKDDDREALNLLARHYLALHDRDKKAVQLEQAWKVTQDALATGKVDREQKDEAIRRAVELTPKIKEELGRSWLEASFTQRPERGMEIIAAIGAATAQGLQTHAFDPDFRTKSLELQKLAVDALLRTAPQRGKEWASSLALLAEGWLKEAEFSHKFDFSTSLGPRMQYDPFGNIYYSNYDQMSPEMMMQRQGEHAPRHADRRRGQEPARRAWLGSLDESDQAQVRHGLRPALPQGQRGREGVSLHRDAVGHPPPPGQGAGRGVPQDLDQEPRPQLAAAPPQPVLLRLRVRIPGGGHPADPLQAGAQPCRAGRLGQEAAEAADRRARREAA